MKRLTQWIGPAIFVAALVVGNFVPNFGWAIWIVIVGIFLSGLVPAHRAVKKRSADVAAPQAKETKDFAESIGLGG